MAKKEDADEGEKLCFVTHHRWIYVCLQQFFTTKFYNQWVDLGLWDEYFLRIIHINFSYFTCVSIFHGFPLFLFFFGGKSSFLLMHACCSFSASSVERFMILFSFRSFSYCSLCCCWLAWLLLQKAKKYFNVVKFNLFVAYHKRKARIWNEIEEHDRVINRREIDSLSYTYTYKWYISHVRRLLFLKA